MHIAVFITHESTTKGNGKNTVFGTNSKLTNINSVTKRPSVGGKDLHRRGLKHTTPLNNMGLLVLRLQ
jgi:hypothetical protein